MITLGKTEVTVPLATRTHIKGTSKNFPANLTNYWCKDNCSALGMAVALVIELGGEIAMLSPEENELLCRTAPGTPMGDLFRRFWLPVALSRELPKTD